MMKQKVRSNAGWQDREGKHDYGSWRDHGFHPWDALGKSTKADVHFKEGMVFLMQGELVKAKAKFKQCLMHECDHREASGHLEVVDFYAKSQRVANATIKFLYRSGKAHRFNIAGVEKQEFNAKDIEETKAAMKHMGYNPENAVAAFGMGRAYLALATEEKPGWKECAKSEFERALALLGSYKAEKYMKAAVHRIYSEIGDRELHLAKMRELDPEIPANW